MKSIVEQQTEKKEKTFTGVLTPATKYWLESPPPPFSQTAGQQFDSKTLDEIYGSQLEVRNES
jgi:hypothetical protein